MKKFLSKHAFWVVQILSWVAAAIFCMVASSVPGDNLWFKMTMVISISLTGVITTSLLRIYLKKNAPLEGFNGKSLLKIGISSVLAAILLILLGTGIIFLLVNLEKFIGVDGQGGTQSSEFRKEGFILFLALFIACLFFILGWVIFYYGIKFIRKSYRQNIERLELRNSVKDAQINMLRGQVDSQFMSESLKKISDLMTIDVKKARIMITKLAEILRFTLVKKNKGNSIVEEEIEVVNNYVEIVKLGKILNFEFSNIGSKELLGNSIPALFILSMVENVIKNGIDLTNKDNYVRLSIFQENEDFILQIEHSAFQARQGEYEAANRRLRQRLNLQFDKNASMLYSNSQNQSKTTVRLPNSSKLEL